MRLIYVLGPAHGKVEEFTPPLGHFWLPPDKRKVLLGEVNEAGEQLYITYVILDWSDKEAYYLPISMGKVEAIKKLMELTGAGNES